MARHLLLSLLLCPLALAAEPAAYEVRGVFREARADGAEARISHEAIPGFMDAMTMEFAVKNRADLAGLRAGDAVAFRLFVDENRSWIERLRRADAAPAIADTTPTPATHVFRVGDRAPDAALVDQSSRAFRLSELRGRAVALTFIFTRCPLPDYCPLLSRQFAAAQALLAGRGVDAARWHFLSVTIDPAHDTPARLAEYARQYGADSARWSFATAGAEEAEALGAAFGVAAARDGEHLSHTLRTAVIDADGRVRRIFVGNGWQPTDLADEIEHVIGPGKSTVPK